MAPAPRIKAGNKIAYNGRGLAYSDKGDVNQAIKDFSEAIRIDPKYAQPYSNRALIWNHALKYDLATLDKDLRDQITSFDQELFEKLVHLADPQSMPM